MPHSKPVVALLGLLVGFVSAIAAWKGWEAVAIRFGDDGEGALETGAYRAAIESSPAAGAAGASVVGLAAKPTTDGSGARATAKTTAATDAKAGPSGEQTDTVLEHRAAVSAAPEPTALQTRFGMDAVASNEVGECPSHHPVKGNANSMIYHLQGQSSYSATRAEVCFTSAEAAESAGFRARKRRSLEAEAAELRQ